MNAQKYGTSSLDAAHKFHWTSWFEEKNAHTCTHMISYVPLFPNNLKSNVKTAVKQG